MLGIEVNEFHTSITNLDDINEPLSLPTKSSSVRISENTSSGRVCVNHFIDPSPVVRYSDEPPEFTDGRVDFGVRDSGIDDITSTYNNNSNVTACNDGEVMKLVKKNRGRGSKKKRHKNKENATTALAFGSTSRGAFLSPNTLRLVKTVVEEKGKGEGIEREVRTNAMVFQGLF